MVNITDADRIAWADYEDFDGPFREQVLSGAHDHTDGLIRFAKHRIATLEQAARVCAKSVNEIGVRHEAAAAHIASAIRALC